MKKSDDILKRFMKEFFPFGEFRKAGLFTKEMKGDYEAQAKRVCEFFGFKAVYEYGAKEIRCHITYADDRLGLHASRPLHVDEEGLKTEPFVTVFPSIYD